MLVQIATFLGYKPRKIEMPARTVAGKVDDSEFWADVAMLSQTSPTAIQIKGNPWPTKTSP